MQTRLISRESSIAIQETYGDKTAAYKLKLDSREVVNIFLHLFMSSIKHMENNKMTKKKKKKGKQSI
jgi:hypothetical protein